ncbi:MAG: hypothetical protein EP330_07135 [Deltaproteobacteria bacterium]|nr:MAG: hypothetical protein EP330_07135 [Deltaproteobacteria bacterium]
MRIVWTIAILIACSARTEGEQLGDCVDRIDNDGDGLVDCDDPDCDAACTEGDTDTDADSDSDSDTDTDCPNRVEEVFPRVGTTDAYVGTTIEARLDVPDANAVLAVPGVVGTSAIDGTRVVFTPSAPLTPSTAYTPLITWGFDCELTWDFSTSAAGAPVDPSLLVGKTYDLDLESGRFVKPEGVGSLLGKYLGRAPLLLGVTSASSTEVALRVAPANDASTQDVCQQSIDVTAPLDTPLFGPTDPFSFLLPVEGVTAPVDDASLSGAFGPGGDSLAGVRLTGRIDTRPLVELIETGGAPEALCDLSASIGVYCEDCGNGDVFCLPLEVDSLQATAVSIALADQSDPYDPCATHAAECPDACP